MAVPSVSLEALTAAARTENRHAARKIAACYRVHCEWMERDVEHKRYSRYGRTEMAMALGCSTTVAESYVSVSVALHTRLPLLRTMFESGEVDLPRVRTACRILDNLDDTIVRTVEEEVVEAARRNPPGPLENEIWDILMRAAPEEAAALREFARRFRRVSYRPGGELSRIDVELSAPEAAAAWQLLEEMADTLCPRDPRGKQERLCDAFMARMHGEPRLACMCGREDCPKSDAVLPDQRVPLTMITVDIATLLGLLADPAYLAGHGSIDPDLARELARNSHWQVLLTEAVTLAEKLGLAEQNPDTGEWQRRLGGESSDSATEAETGAVPEAVANTASTADDARRCAATRATEPRTGLPPEATPRHDPDSIAPQAGDPGPNRSRSGSSAATSDSMSTEGRATRTDTAAAAAGNGRNQRRLRSLISAASLFCTHTPVARGTRHSSALDLPSAIRPDHPTAPTAGHTPAGRTGLYLGNASLAAALEAAIAADPALARSVSRDPLTDRALIYRPDTRTTAAVRLRDAHCRFPGCRRPAPRCQLDHVIPFDHTNPLGGGWSTINNLQCLCEYHHTVKTAGYWSATMLPGGAILWRSISKTTRITLPANGTTVPIPGNDFTAIDLRPHIPTQPRRSGIIAYLDPPDDHEPETPGDSEAPF